ncbi:HupE/UreJ family protein [Chitinivorax sp. PXF-14]|uniref:HupE/UreJ family protein n=1 Tax=Chitinivorax sp. PXF-14 TaxID=3230488 RepID=UPI003464EACD
MPAFLDRLLSALRTPRADGSGFGPIPDAARRTATTPARPGWLAGCVLLLLLAAPAQAHKASDSYLMLAAHGEQVTGHWDIALRDLDEAIGLDADQDGQLTWGEVKARHGAIAAYALTRLGIEGGGRPCRLDGGQQTLERHTDGVYTSLPLTATCPAGTASLRLDYRLLFDLDRLHRGLARVSHDGSTESLVFSPEQPRQSVTERGSWQTAVEFARQGVIHIWTGYDHILFLLSLLLPAVLVWRDGGWQASAGWRPGVADTARVVTSFTLAHSITLSLAALGVVSLESRWVESTIAASVVLAAINNLYPVIRGRRWAVAFGFGLIHGFGFASVLAELALPRAQLVTALVSFNLGVELGQLAIVAAFLPLAYALRGSWLYRRLTVSAGSIAIIVLAGNWFVQRAFNLPGL